LLFQIHFAVPVIVTSFTINNASEATVNGSEPQTVTLACSAIGRPTPSIRIRTPQGDELQTTSKGDGREVSFQATLCDQNGYYLCETENQWGKAKETVELAVVCKFYFVSFYLYIYFVKILWSALSMD
jgi:hypothetical protein